MRFYELDPALKAALDALNGRVIPLVEVMGDEGAYISMPPDAVREAQFRSYQDRPGCCCVNGKMTLRDEKNLLAGLSGRDREIRILFGVEESEATLHRFTVRPDEKGFIRFRKGGISYIRCRVEDAPERMKKEIGCRDWTEKEVLTDCFLSDKSRPEVSLVHRIAARAGLSMDEIDSCQILLPQIYVKLSASPWEELCSLVDSILGILEGGLDRAILLSDSPYGDEPPETSLPDELPEELFYSLEEEEAGDLYFNEVRLKWNKPERLIKDVIWTYQGSPVEFDTDLMPVYPLRPGGSQPILDEAVPFEAPYVVMENHQLLGVVYADELQSLEEVQSDLVFEADGGGSTGLELSFYTAESTRALLNLNCSAAGYLKNLTIKGRPVVIRQNQACYERNEEEIARWGQKVLNATGKYFTTEMVQGTGGEQHPHFEDWVIRRLEKAVEKRKRFTARSDRGIFFVRTGALCRLLRAAGNVTCRVEEYSLDYGIERGMDSTVTLIEDEL